MMRYKTKFNLLRDEVVKANNELVDNEIFETYMDEEQDAIMVTNTIVRALVKTIKTYEQADYRLERTGDYVISDCSDYIAKLEREYEELQELLTQRDKEINALKHMLDRKDDENEICDY